MGWQLSLYAGTTGSSTFAGWKGRCLASGNRCDLTVGDHGPVTATFVP